MAELQKRQLTASAAGPLSGRIRVRGDISISHRALLLGALGVGTTEIRGLLRSEDVQATAAALRSLGVEIETGDGVWRVHGRGVGGLTAPGAALDFGNSGTGVRLMMGVLAGHDFECRLTGDASLSRRPMGRVVNPLREMGVEVDCEDAAEPRLPLTFRGSADLLAMTYELPVASAQIKSAILLAGLHAAGETTVVEAEPTRDHTERMLTHFGAAVRVREDAVTGRRAITVCGEAELAARDIDVPGDPSSAAFAAAGAIIVPGSDVTIEGVLTNPTRTGFYETLLEMGADLIFENAREQGGEPVADLRVRWRAELGGVRVPADRAPRMIDEYPILACVAAFARGETRMEGLAELRVKESDRLAATARGLAACGVTVAIEGDTLIVSGDGQPKGGGVVETELDHRIAMAFLTLGLASAEPVTVDDVSMIATSFPDFTGLMARLGAHFQMQDAEGS